jgi:hypothetical protein
MTYTNNEAIVGEFAKSKETKNTYVYARTTEAGRRETHYVAKDLFAGSKVPETIEVVIRWS